MAEIGDGGTTKMLVATGRLERIPRLLRDRSKTRPRKGIMHRPEAAELLGVKVGDQVLVGRR